MASDPVDLDSSDGKPTVDDLLRLLQRFQFLVQAAVARANDPYVDSEDIMQEIASLILLGKYEHFSEGQFTRWIRTTTQNFIRNALRRRRQSPLSPNLEVADCRNPLRHVDISDAAKKLLEQLPERTREVVVRLARGQNHKSIARDMAISVPTVGREIVLARQTLGRQKPIYESFLP